MYFLFPVTDPIALSVALTDIITVTDGDTINFNYVFIDTHGLYNPNVGIFTIPQTGIYEVNVNLYKSPSSIYNDAIADLFVNNTPLTRIHNYDSHGTGRAHSSCTIIREFTIGHTLHVRARNTASYFGDSLARSQFNVKYLGEVSQNA